MPTLPRAFDAELLKRPAEARIAFFVGKRVAHRNQLNALNRILNILDTDPYSTTLLVMGPTGVGKTTLMHKLVATIYEAEWSAMQADPGYIPVVAMQAVKPETGNFNWKNQYRRNLEAFYGPLTLQGRPPLERTPPTAAIPFRYSTITDMRNALVSCIRERGTKYNLIDEAQSLLKITSKQLLVDQMDIIKSFSLDTGVKQILFGTYELTRFFDLSGQLNRRSKVIHFPRYKPHDPSDPADWEAFLDALATFQTWLPFEEPPDLLSEALYFYHKSAGCIGILKEWLDITVTNVLLSGIQKLELLHFKEMAKSNRELKKIITEINDGETKMLDLDDAEIYQLLGMSLETESQSAPKEKPRKKRRVGERNPTRDSVGGVQNGTA